MNGHTIEFLPWPQRSDLKMSEPSVSTRTKICSGTQGIEFHPQTQKKTHFAKQTCACNKVIKYEEKVQLKRF